MTEASGGAGGLEPPLGRAVPRSFFARDPLEVAPELLNKLLVVADGRAGRIVEVEAYCGAADPASHAYRGPTARNAAMFGPAGHLYVYLSYGIHWCANVVCGDCNGLAVLFRAAAPAARSDAIRSARPGRRDRDLASGPGRLAQALGISRGQDGADLVTGNRGVWLVKDGTPPPAAPATGPRIGLTKATDQPWRWWVAGDRNVSTRASGSRVRTG